MKQYVLDEPSAGAPHAAHALGSAATSRPTLPRQPWPWGALLVLAIVEPFALGALYFGLDAETRPRGQAEALGPATIAAFAVPTVPGQSGAAALATADLEESRIALERGKYVISLRSTEIGSELAMLAQATKATVHGADALSREPTRLSRSAVVATPAEAWQAVLGDVANFAISCAPSGCAVFVSMPSNDGAAPATLASTAPAFAAPALGSEMAAVDPVAAAAAITAAAAGANGSATPDAAQAADHVEPENL